MQEVVLKSTPASLRIETGSIASEHDFEIGVVILLVLKLFTSWTHGLKQTEKIDLELNKLFDQTRS